MINNGSNRGLPVGGNLPDMSAPIIGWFIPMTFIRVIKETVNYQIEETTENIKTQGVWQPFSPKQLTILPEGQRQWSWFMIHALPDLKLNIDEIISYNGVEYRVMRKMLYNEYNYIQYDVILGYGDKND